MSTVDDLIARAAYVYEYGSSSPLQEELRHALSAERTARLAAEADRDEYLRMFTECHPIHLKGVLEADELRKENAVLRAVIEKVRKQHTRLGRPHLNGCTCGRIVCATANLLAAVPGNPETTCGKNV